MKRTIRPQFNAEDDDEDLEQLQREFFEKKVQPSASVVRGGLPPSTAPAPTTTIGGALASMPTLENVESDMPALEGVADPNPQQPHVPEGRKMLDLTSLLGNILSDVTENKVEKVEAPSLKSGTERSQQHVQGFPKPARRSVFKMRMEAKNKSATPEQPQQTTTTTTSATQDFERDNVDRIANMTEEEIEAARKEIVDSLSADSIAMLMNRGGKKSKKDSATMMEQGNNEEDKDDDDEGEEDLMVMKERYFADVPTEYEKLAWMDSRFDVNPKNPQEQEQEGQETSEEDKMYRRLRFDFQGKPVDPNADLPVHQGLHHHGDEPDKAGYTLAELFYLVRSQVAPQRTMVLNTLARILRNAKANRGTELWDKVLALFYRPDLAATIYLRSAMDDRHLVVLVAAVQAMAALVLEKGDELDEEPVLDVEQFNEYLGYVARPHVQVQEENGGLGEKFATTVDRLRGKDQEDDEEEEPEDDAQLAQRDLTKGLLRMSILPRIRYLTSRNSELDSRSIDLLVRVLIRLAKSGAEVCESILEHDLVDQVLAWGVLEREWPMTSPEEDEKDVYPSLAALRLLTILAQGSRRVAEAINAKATCLLQYLATPPNVACPSLQKRAYALQVETIKLLRVLVCYGLVMPALQDLHEPMMSWLRAGLTQNMLDDARAATTISLLEISLHAAADPHKTTPAHAIDWHQPTAFIPVILAILRTREPSMMLDTAVGYFATLASYIDRFPTVDDTITTADIWKVAVEKLASTAAVRSSFSNSVLRYVQLLGAFASAKTFESDAAAILASPSVTRLVKQVHNNGFLGRLALWSWAIHVKDRSVRIKLWGKADDDDGYDAAELESTVGSVHVGALEMQLARNLVQQCVLDRFSSKLASTLALFYLRESTFTTECPLLLDHDGPRLKTLVYPDRQQPDTPPSATAWVFSPIDEMYHMDKSCLAQKCTHSSADVVGATLEAAAVLLNTNVDRDMAIVSLMKVFMVTERDASDREVFWDDRVTRLVDDWLDRLFLGPSSSSSSSLPLCQRKTDAGSLEAAWRRSSALIRQPFYQFYQAFVAQYASVSFGHSGFARLLAYVVTQADAIDYKYLVWSDYRDILPTIKVKPEALPRPDAGGPEERANNTALLRAYMSAVAESKVEGALREFAVSELEAAAAAGFTNEGIKDADVPNNLKRDIRDLLNK
ncbi:hypothetical protein BDB00DRAFT_769968 [Zychaea mexicana]|uniref:uncharacterized protein n=1 Tax=Zychaea mexicana TaxID=64656 RepID=UPI0022FE98D8|nr:uncharacterized protein BDB00DRAFT_769968 [Zychaea mexicana]KAI9489772.1 hypothetical protein BDB00DRAFT_769968 [Zychaea mexicana]